MITNDNNSYEQRESPMTVRVHLHSNCVVWGGTAATPAVWLHSKYNYTSALPSLLQLHDFNNIVITSPTHPIEVASATAPVIMMLLDTSGALLRCHPPGGISLPLSVIARAINSVLFMYIGSHCYSNIEVESYLPHAFIFHFDVTILLLWIVLLYICDWLFSSITSCFLKNQRKLYNNGKSTMLCSILTYLYPYTVAYCIPSALFIYKAMNCFYCV